MSELSDGAVVALVTHARAVPASDRLAFAVRLRERSAPGSIVIETCHRVEGYTAASGRTAVSEGRVGLPAGGVRLTGIAAMRHAVAVAVGRDSVVEGEDQVLHQFRAAIDLARRSGVHPVLDRLFTVALGAGRRARSWHQGPRRSLADAALAIVEERLGDVRGRPILIVGAGTMGRLAAKASAALGAEVSIASRSAARARDLAAAMAGRPEAFEPGPAVGDFSAIIVALGGPWPLGPQGTRALTMGSTLVIDLSQPPAVPPAIGAALGDRLMTADALARVGADRWLAPVASRARLDELVERTVAEFETWLAARSGRDAASLLVDLADREREAELEELWRRHPGFDPETRVAIEAMTRHLARRILREPLERLGRDADGHGAKAARDLFAL